jgi:hypothetical protein
MGIQIPSIILMHKLTRMRYSRNDWKDKARERAEEIREFRKKIIRRDQKILDLEEELSKRTENICVKKNELRKHSI